MNGLCNIYTKLTACVTSPDGISKYFSCNIGIHQGCAMSPSLFIQWLNEYFKMLELDKCNVLLAYLYADEIENVSDTANKLQNILNSLSTFC